MAIAPPLVKAARKLITSFGNNATLYKYASSKITTDDEGGVLINIWGATTSTVATTARYSTIKVVDGGNAGLSFDFVKAGIAAIGSDEKIVMDSVVIATNDRLTYNGYDFKITGLRTERVESTDIIKIIRCESVTDTTRW